MKPTPETDKAMKYWPSEDIEFVYSDFARRLENERDEARKEIEFLKKTPLQQRCQQLEREIDHWCDMHTIASKQRDEAREVLRMISVADWKTAGELRGMARRALEAAK